MSISEKPRNEPRNVCVAGLEPDVWLKKAEGLVDGEASNHATSLVICHFV